jgi:glycosyltransferase involved in cell wall biosynthesis
MLVQMDQKNKILLSICIPTFNRAELLRSSLYSLVPQIKEFEDEVELIVSDNNSQDNTEEIVKWAQQFGPIRYSCNPENIGACNNILLLANQLAQGEFCWILGDDDFVRPNAVKKILDVIKTYSEIDYIYVNIAHFSTELLKKYPTPVSSAEIPYNLPLGNKDRKEYYVEKWDTLITPDISPVFFGAIQVSIVRRSVWCKFSGSLIIGEPFSSLDSTYPHIIIFGKGLIGKKAYYIGDPLIIVIDGAREWLEYVPKICLVYLHEALDHYETNGADPIQIEKCRKFLVKNNSGFITKILKHKTIKDIDFNFATDYVEKYWKYLSFKCLILNAPMLTQLFLKNKKR